MINHWKTTANGILSFLIATLTTLTAFQVPAALVPNANRTYLYFTVGTNLLVALCRVWIGLLQNDAPPPDSVSVQTTVSQKVVLLLLALIGSVAASAQVVPPVAVDPANLYFAGTSYSQGATPSVAGTALYARKLADNSGYTTYAFTMVDAIPASIKPFTVSTNIGAGIAQKAFVIAGVPVYIPTAAGISFNGNSVGWVWNTGVGVPFQIKRQGQGTNWYVMPTVRINKASIGGSGYQPIVGVLFGWGQ